MAPPHQNTHTPPSLALEGLGKRARDHSDCPPSTLPTQDQGAAPDGPFFFFFNILFISF